jgi:hypothetical protein
MPIAAACPQCKKRFQLAPTLLGKKVKCSGCGNPFTVQGTGIQKAAVTVAPKRRVADDEDDAPARTVTRRVRDKEDDDESERRSPRKKKRKRKKSSNAGLIVGLSIGGVAVVAVIVVVTILAIRSGRRPEVIAQAPPADALAKVLETPPPATVTPPAPPQAEPVAVPQPQPQPEPQPEPTSPPPMETVTPTPMPETPEVTTPPPPSLKQGAKITVRTEISGTPPGFNGDYNGQIRQSLENTLRQMGYQTVSDGGLVLTVRADFSPTGKNVSVRSPNQPPPPPPRPIVKGRPVGPPPRPPMPQMQSYGVDQLNASIVLTDMQGSAMWKNEKRFTPNTGGLGNDPTRAMHDQMWRSFDGWIRGNVLATMKKAA